MIDEALATGDANLRAKSHEKIMDLRGEAGTVFLVAHNLAEIEASCNRVIWLEKGKIMKQGYEVPAIVDAYLEATGGEPRKRDTPVDANDISSPSLPPLSATTPGSQAEPLLSAGRRRSRMAVPPEARESAVTSPF